MIRGLRVLAVCPARGGSKGIPLKNLRPFRGVPLVARVGRVVEQVPAIDRAVVSTDHEGIAAVAAAAGLDAPFRRPETLAGDRISDVQVLSHALERMEAIDAVRYEIVVMLQPTSPLRRAADVTRAIEMLVDGGWDAVWTVSETDSKSHPLKQLVLEGEALHYYDPAGGEIIARQELAPVHHRNGVAYAITRRCLLEARSLSGARTGGLILPGHRVSIDTLWDLEQAEYVYEREKFDR